MPETRSLEVSIRPLLADDTASVLAAILSAADFGVLLTGLDHTAFACNRKFGEIWNVDIDKVVLSGVQELRDSVKSLIADLPSWEENLERIYSDLHGTQIDEMVLLKSPNITIRRFSGPVLDAKGAVIGRLWTFTDITQEVRSRQLHEALNRFSSFYASKPTDVYDKIVETIVEMFPGSASLLSLIQDDFLEFRAAAGLPAEAAGMRGNMMKDSYCQFAIQSGATVKIEDATLDDHHDVLPRKAGYTRYLGAPLHDEVGKIIGTLCLLDLRTGEPFHDEEERFLSLLAMRAASEVSRERHIQARLEEKEKELARQAEDLDKTRSVLESMNRAFELLGQDLTTDELAAMQLAIIRDLPEVESAAIVLEDENVGWALAKNAETFQRFEGANGSWLSRLGSKFVDEKQLAQLGTLYIGRARAVKDDQLYATHIEAIAEQVTLLFSIHLLQGRLQKTTGELRATQEQLLRGEKLSVVGTLAAATAHDIKNIMSALSLELSFSADLPGAPLGAIREHLDRFTVLAHRLLSYAKPRMIARRAIKMEELIHGVIGLVQGHMRLSEVQLQLEIESELPAISGDVHQLEHLFVNLILNALQAMDSKGGVLTVRISLCGDFVVASVEDTGRGMSEEHLSKIFEPFFSSRQEGFGLGLYSCQRIVADHDGEIRAESKLGVGSRIIVSFPVENTQ